MPVPAIPGAGLVVRQTQFCLGGLERILNRPAPPLDRYQRRNGCAGRAPGREEGELPIRQAAAEQEPARPDPWEALVVLIRFQVSEFAVSPVIETLTLRAGACRERLPGALIELLGNL